MRALVTGGAGFIGSTLVDRLLSRGDDVTVYDDFSTGRREFLKSAEAQRGFRLVEGDVQDLARLQQALLGHDMVFHYAANADVRFGTLHPKRDLEQNTIGTFNVLEAMRGAGVRRLAFTSTGSVYGEPELFPTPEDAPFPVQTSLYGASKLAGEGLIAAYVNGFGYQAWIFRLVSLLGERYTHGHVFDFYRKLRADPTAIEVLGDGRQRKSYLYVQDCIDVMLLAVEKSQAPLSILNLGREDYCTVDESLGWICAHLGLAPERRHQGGTRGWIGDSPFILLDTKRARGLGWQPKVGIKDAVIRTLEFLEAHPWALERG